MTPWDPRRAGVSRIPTWTLWYVGRMSDDDSVVSPNRRPRRRSLLFLCLGFLAAGASCAGPARVSSPLRLHPSHPRYFLDGQGKTVYLTGSHTWNQCQDGFDFEAYLRFLGKYNHNFIRLWSGDYALGGAPAAYLRTGPGMALDGLPRVDLERPNPAFFERVRA